MHDYAVTVQSNHGSLAVLVDNRGDLQMSWWNPGKDTHQEPDGYIVIARLDMCEILKVAEERKALHSEDKQLKLW